MLAGAMAAALVVPQAGFPAMAGALLGAIISNWHPLLVGFVWSAVFGALCWAVFRLARPEPAVLRDAALMAGAVFVVGLGGQDLGWLFREHVIQAFRMPSESMVPTLRSQDYFFAWKPGAVPPARGDVIVFGFPRATRPRPSASVWSPCPAIRSRSVTRR